MSYYTCHNHKVSRKISVSYRIGVMSWEWSTVIEHVTGPWVQFSAQEKKTQVTNGQMLSHQKFGSPYEKTLFKIPIFISNLSGVH